jgi:hypothetical protein
MLASVCFVLAVSADSRAHERERPTQAYAHVLMAEWNLAHGDREGAIEELRYALVFDHDNTELKARLSGLDGGKGLEINKSRGRASKGLAARSLKRARWKAKWDQESLPLEDKTSRRVAESRTE